jgi:hypothetical protein
MRLIVIDASPDAGLWQRMNGPVNFPYAVYVHYGRYQPEISAMLCRADQVFIAGEAASASPDEDGCHFLPAGLVVRYSGSVQLGDTYDNLVLIEYNGGSGFVVLDTLPDAIAAIAPESRYAPLSRLRPDGA